MAYSQNLPKPHLPLLLILSITLLISSLQAQESPNIRRDPQYYYNLCAPSRCNNIALMYPYLLPTLCHYSPLQVWCPNNLYLLSRDDTSSATYRVLSIDYSNPITTRIMLASDSLFTCGAQVSRPNYFDGAGPFTLPPNTSIGTHFNCTAPIPSGTIRGLQNASCLGCRGQDPSNVCYYAPGIINPPPNCENFHIFTRGVSFNATSVRDLRGFLRSGFEIRYNKLMECRGCEASGGRCGANPLSASFVCFCPSSVHSGNCSDGTTMDLTTWVDGPRRQKSGPSKAVVAAISVCASTLIAGAIVGAGVICLRRQKHDLSVSKETFSTISPTRYSYSQLKKFTNNYSLKLGEGGFGSVYKGTIHRDGLQIAVAVKILKNSRQTKQQFMTEVATIGSIHHHNLVSMLGYCVEGETHALVYEFMENGSLDKYIYNIKKGNDGEYATEYKLLSRKQVYNIALETARGILYLHKGCSNKIVHCDIKPPNVLLDTNCSAKVSDFGLAKMIDKDHSHVSLTVAQGTPGYAAPEIWMKTHGPVTEKSDVYSYGMLVLEMVGRRRNYDAAASGSSQVYFPEWLYKKIERDEFPLLMRNDCDDSLDIVHEEENVDDEDKEVVKRMCLVGLWCIQYLPSNRPSMDKVVQMLEGHVEIVVPPYPFPGNQISEGTSVDALG